MAAQSNSTGYSNVSGGGRRRGDDADIIRRLRQQVEQAIDATAGTNTQRDRAWRQFALEPNQTESEGRSVFQDASVNSMVTAWMAQSVTAFSGDDVVKFEANSAEDEVGVEAESRAVNKVLLQINDGRAALLDAMQNALLYRVGIFKVWWQLDISTWRDRFTDVEPPDVPITVDTGGDPSLEKRLLGYDAETQIARVETTQTTRKLKLSAVDNSLFFIDPDWTEKRLTGVGLCGEVHYKTRDELSRMGVDWAIVKELPAVQKFSGETRVNRRRNDNLNQVDPVVFQMDVVRCFEVYARLAWDDDADRALLYKCWIGDQTKNNDGWLLDPVEVARVPYAAARIFPLAGRFEGEALAEKLYSIQEGATELQRQWFDNVQVNSVGRVGAVVGQVEMSDVVTPRAGSPIRLKSPTALVPVPINDVGPSIAAALLYLDQKRTERGGASIEFLRGDQQLARETAHGTERTYQALEYLQAYGNRNFGEDFEDVALIAHAELREAKNGPIKVKVGEQYVDVDPATWPARDQCNVQIGYSMGERVQISQALMLTMQTYLQGFQLGWEGQLVTKQGLYKLATDYLAMNLVDNPSSYFIDPTSEQAQQAAQAAQQAQLQQAKMQAEVLAMPEETKGKWNELVQEQKNFVEMFKTVFEGTLDHDQAQIQGAVDVARAASEAKAVQATAAAGGAAGAGKGPNGSGASRRGNGSSAGSGADRAGNS